MRVIDNDTAKEENISVKSNFTILHKPKKWMKLTNALTKFSIISLGIPPEIDATFRDGK